MGKLAILITSENIKILHANKAEKKRLVDFADQYGIGIRFLQLLLGDLEGDRIKQTEKLNDNVN